jgi:transcriptional regulator with XRE-family HTH domain
LRELARRIDLTASFLSQVERGKTNTSIDSLRRIATALDVPILHLLSDSQTDNAKPSNPKHNPVVRADHRSRLSLPDSHVTYELLTPDLARKMEVFTGRLAPGNENVARPLREPTEECIYVLSGALCVGLDAGEYILHPGDTIYFEGAALKKLACASQEEVTWISVITPPVF